MNVIFSLKFEYFLGGEEDEDDSDDARRTWCFCNEKSYGDMVACDNKDVSLLPSFLQFDKMFQVNGNCITIASCVLFNSFVLSGEKTFKIFKLLYNY